MRITLFLALAVLAAARQTRHEKANPSANRLCDANSFDYLIDLQRHAGKLAATPG
jgi:hypothetical protein